MNEDDLKNHSKTIDILSNRLYGEAIEMDFAEGEDLLRQTGVEPNVFLRRVSDKLATRAETHGRQRNPTAIVLEKAIGRLRAAASAWERAESTEEAKTVIRSLFERIRLPPEAFEANISLSFSAAYRKKKDLSEKDKSLLDAVARELETRVKISRKDS
jgi:hypothetical protein